MDIVPTSLGDREIALVIFGTTLLSGLGLWLWSEARGDLRALAHVAALWLVVAAMAGIAGSPFPLIMLAGTALAITGIATLRWAEAHW
ncbi:hypothetical protein MLD63_09565 [Paracoccus sp. TK19116]|uniref:Uncharacterized protein n=1 Tax=Paracoccus albicereus TaxID=2922394 RepID=A0ABT1MT19_9RHOB|nr:hypothetical protein [Paracoccus albicereus]MCQ0970671.1 hypothetical protein [Paracoccus albicereus]